MEEIKNEQPANAETPKPESTNEQPKATSVDSGLEFEKVKRYVDSSIAKMLDDIIKKDREQQAKKLEPEEKKEPEKW